MQPGRTTRATRFAGLSAAALLVAACGGGSGPPGQPPPPEPEPEPEPQHGTLALAASTYSVDEADATLDIEVTRTGGADGDVSVRLHTSTGSADEDDYVPVDTTVTFADGDSTAKTTSIQLNDDDRVEGSETFSVSLSDVTGGAALGTHSAQVTLLDNDGQAPPAESRLNDTGVDRCLDTSTGAFVACSGGGSLSLQDGARGRDVDAPGNGDGRLGFVLTKLDANGEPLADQAADYATTPWPCVRDDVTGLTWEVKTADTPDASLGSRDATYTWWDPATERRTAAHDGGDCALDDCTTGDYVLAQNDAALCGFDDWRLPAPNELLSLIDYGADTPPLIDTAFFPNAAPTAWAQGGENSLRRPFAGFGTGAIGQSGPYATFAIRLVRGGI